MSQRRPPGALVVDFATVQRFESALLDLKRAWQDIPAAARPGLSRLLWLHTSGEVVVYRAPDGPWPDAPHGSGGAEGGG